MPPTLWWKTSSWSAIAATPKAAVAPARVVAKPARVPQRRRVPRRGRYLLRRRQPTTVLTKTFATTISPSDEQPCAYRHGAGRWWSGRTGVVPYALGSPDPGRSLSPAGGTAGSGASARCGRKLDGDHPHRSEERRVGKEFRS